MVGSLNVLEFAPTTTICTKEPLSVMRQIGANSRTFSDPTIASDHTYTYKVRAYNSSVVGYSAYSNEASVSTVVGQPIPTGLTATPSVLSTAAPTVTLRFTDNSTTETSFTIQRSTDPTFQTGVTTLTGIPASPGKGLTVTVTNSPVSEATTYYYQVRAIGSPANSAWSNIATATTPGRLPIAPSNVRSGGGATRVSIPVRWNDNSNNETGFTVSRGPSNTGPWTLVTTTTANVTSTTVTGLVRGTHYFFQVIAINTYGQSTAAVTPTSLSTLP